MALSSILSRIRHPSPQGWDPVCGILCAWHSAQSPALGYFSANADPSGAAAQRDVSDGGGERDLGTIFVPGKSQHR